MGSAITNSDSDSDTLAFFQYPSAAPSWALAAIPYSAGMQAACKGYEGNCQARELADVLRGILEVQKAQSCSHVHDHFPPAAAPSTGEIRCAGVFSPLSVLEHDYATHPSMLEINNNDLLQGPFFAAAEGAAAPSLQSATDQGSNSEHIIPLFLDNFGAMPAFGSMLDHRVNMDERSCSMQCDDKAINQINAASEDDFNKVRGGGFSDPGLITVMGHPCMLQGINANGVQSCGSPSAISDCDSNGSNNKPTFNGNFGAKVGYHAGNATCSAGVSVVFNANHPGNTACNGDGKLLTDDDNNNPTCADGADYYRASMREVVYAAAALQPVDWESIMEATAGSRPKRRNVRISKDPQSVSARRRRERIGDRIRVLQRLVPGGTKMDTASMLDEAIHYLKFLKSQVQALEWLERSTSSVSSPSSSYYYPTLTTTPPNTNLINMSFPQCPS